MTDSRLRYYILFDNYEQGLALHDRLDQAGLKNRIAPAPRALEGAAACGMALLLPFVLAYGVALLVEPDEIQAVRSLIAETDAPYHSIQALADQLRSHRDRYC